MHDIPNRDPPETDHVVRLLMENRSSLFAFVFAATRDFDASEDILQEVAVTVCEKANDFEQGTNFLAWSREIARRRVAAHWRLKKRNEQGLSEEQLGQLMAGFERTQADIQPEDRMRALRRCLNVLKPFSRQLLQLRDDERLSLAEVGKRVSRQPDSVRKALYRGRLALRDCIEQRLATSPIGGGCDER